MHAIKLYGKFIRAFLKKRMEYRFSFFTSIFLQVITYSNLYLIMWILLNQFENINGWSFYEIMFLYTLNLFSYACAGMFIKHPMLDMEGMIQSGDFDSILTKPLNPLFHVVARQFEYTFAGHMILCVFTFWLSISNIGIAWSAKQIVFLVAFLIGATLIQAAFMIISGSICFFTVKSQSAVETAIYGLRSFLDYPLSIFPKVVQVIMTFVLPYAFVNFYPAEYFLHKTDPALFGLPILTYLTPLVGVVLMAIALLLWRFGVKNYKSTGS